MTVKFMERIPTVDYGYVEVEADAFAEFTEASAAAHDHMSSVVESQAVQRLQDGGLTTPNPGLSGPAPEWKPSTSETPPSCAHGPMKWVPPGVSKTSGKPYSGFWGCQAPQGQRCQRS